MTASSSATQPAHQTQTTGPSHPDKMVGPGDGARENPRSRATTEGALSIASWYVPSQGALDSGTASRALQAVSSIAPPEGGIWKGSADPRSIKRFLDSISTKVRTAALSAHAAYHYLLDKCLSGSLAEEVSNHCQSAWTGDYVAACAEAGEFLMEAYKSTNKMARFADIAENLVWAQEAVDFEVCRPDCCVPVLLAWHGI
jgi:hypothetical protein